MTNLSETGTCLAPLPMLALSVQLRTDLFPPSSTLTQALSPPAWAPCQHACSWVSGAMQLESQDHQEHLEEEIAKLEKEETKNN